MSQMKRIIAVAIFTALNAFAVEIVDQQSEIFGAIFKPGFKKDGFETTEQYRKRMAETGLSGREVVFLSKGFSIEPNADKGVYKIKAFGLQTSGKMPPQELPLVAVEGFPIGMATTNLSTNMMQNSFGAQFLVVDARSTNRQIFISNIEKISRDICSRTGPLIMPIYELSVTFSNPQSEFIELLKRRRILVGFKGVIQDVNLARQDITASAATPQSPIQLLTIRQLIPISLSELLIVNSDTHELIFSRGVTISEKSETKKPSKNTK
jgi:hypothetical protein